MKRPTMTPREREVLSLIAQLPAGGIHERDLLRMFPGRHPNLTAGACHRRGWVDVRFSWRDTGRVWRITREGLRALRGREPVRRSKVRALAMALGGGER